MTWWATIDAGGLASGFYTDELHDTIPDAAVQISDAQYAEWVQAMQTTRWDGAGLVAYTPPPPPPSEVIAVGDFRARFTGPEWAAIMAAATGSGPILGWVFATMSAGAIDLGSAATGAGLDPLVAAGLLTEARRAAILTP